MESDLLLRSRSVGDAKWVDVDTSAVPDAPTAPSAAAAAAAASGGAAARAKGMYVDGLLDAGAWARDVKAKFVGGGDALTAARRFWWSCVFSVAGVALTTALEPACNDMPCIQHASACPLPYPLTHRSLGYSLDLVALALLLLGALAVRDTLAPPTTSRAPPATAISRAPAVPAAGTGAGAAEPGPTRARFVSSELQAQILAIKTSALRGPPSRSPAML